MFPVQLIKLKNIFWKKAVLSDKFHLRITHIKTLNLLKTNRRKSIHKRIT